MDYIKISLIAHNGDFVCSVNIDKDNVITYEKNEVFYNYIPMTAKEMISEYVVIDKLMETKKKGWQLK